MEHKCRFCGKEFKSGQSLGGHLILCSKNPNNHIKDFNNIRQKNKEIKNPILHKRLICCICGNEYEISVSKKHFDNGKYKHTCSRHCASILTGLNTNLIDKNSKISLKLKEHEPYNKNTHYENGILVCNDEQYNKSLHISKLQTCKHCGKVFEINEVTKRGFLRNISFCSNECKHNYFSTLAKNRKLGGYVENSIKKHHKGNYMGIHCDSSWELAYVVYCIEHNIPIKRCKEKRTYIHNGKIKTYFPDFVINNNQIVEIKGYYDIGAKLKHEQNDDIMILMKNDLNDVLHYVTKKYGNKFWEKLYD